jgi:hypothetical protein
MPPTSFLKKHTINVIINKYTPIGLMLNTTVDVSGTKIILYDNDFYV